MDIKPINDYNMIEFDSTDNEFQGSAIENLFLYGNKDSCACCINGINIENYSTYSDSPRGQLRIKNVFIYNFNGTGLNGGVNQNELYLDEVITYGCNSDGIVLGGQDIKANRVQSAANCGCGFVITGGGAGRFYDIDCWSNNIGIDITDTMNIFMFGFSANNNNYGIFIHPSSPTSSTAYSPTMLNFYRGTFDANVICDFKVSSNSPKFGGSNILLNGCLFRGSTASTKATHAIIDDSYQPARNIVSDSFFYSDRYGVGFMSPNGQYKFRDCFDYSTRAVLDEFTLKITNTNANYTIQPTDSYISVGYTGSTNVVITVPEPTLVQKGKVLYITKLESNTGAITLVSGGTYQVLGDLVLNTQFSTLMLTNFLDKWISIKIR